MATLYLRRADLLLINRRTVARHGGHFVEPENILKAEALAYAVDAPKMSVFGADAYPGISDKAAIYLFSIIGNHVFQDGNKRTGLEAALLFLRLNGYRLVDDITLLPEQRTDTVPEKPVSNVNLPLWRFTNDVARGALDLDACRAWFQKNAVER